jgi:hypothetical protein
MGNYFIGVGTIPSDLTDVPDEELVSFQKHLLQLKRENQKEIDHIDTEVIGIKEEVRKRKEKGRAAQTFRNAFMKD